MLNHLSTCKSPQGMLSPVVKELLPKYHEGFTKENIAVVSIMPCTAKKYERTREQLMRDGKAETDVVLTTQEFARMIKSAGIDFASLEEEKADSPFGEYTGAATIFGASGGVAEAAARTAYYLVTGENITNDDIKEMRGVDKNTRSKTVELDIKGTHVVVRVVSTLKEAEKAIQEIKNGTAKFQLLEVMACPGGCVNGGGQPRSSESAQTKVERAEGLYEEDANLKLRHSHENPDIIRIYKDDLEKPNSHLAHELLHTTYADKRTGSYKDIN